MERIRLTNERVKSVPPLEPPEDEEDPEPIERVSYKVNKRVDIRSDARGALESLVTVFFNPPLEKLLIELFVDKNQR